MTTLQDQPNTQPNCILHFQSNESGASQMGAVTMRDVRITSECRLGENCRHVTSKTSKLEGLWYNHANPNVVQYQLPDDDAVYEIRAKGDEGTECDGPTKRVPYAWRKSEVSFKAPNGWGKRTLVPDGSKIDQSGLKRDKNVYTADNDTLVGSGKADGQEGEAL